MKLSIISFTQKGIELSEKIANLLDKTECTLYTKCSNFLSKNDKKVQFVEESIGEWAREQMERKNALIFIGACGIAVRAIAPSITDKLQDSPVIVIDEKGQYVIPILSGHMGGANELAIDIANIIAAEPVITTATDINQKFAVDIFAKKNELSIVNKAGIAKVSSKVLSGRNITMSVESGHFEKVCQLPKGIYVVDYPPIQPVDIVISSEKRAFDTLILLRPKEYVIGIGCRKGKESKKIEDFIKRTIEKLQISIMQVRAVTSIDLKRNEQGLLEWSRKMNIPFITYTAEELREVEGDFKKSDFVKAKVGVDNVCERAALKVCEPMGELVYEKHTEDGMAIAVARREWSVSFDET